MNHDSDSAYADYLRRPWWRGLRQWKIDNVGGKCERCGSTLNLQVHHLTYDTLGEEMPWDLEVLCKRCHGKEHATEILATMKRYGVFDHITPDQGAA